MTDTFTFNWNVVANLIMAAGTIGLFVIARRRYTSDVRLVADPVSREHCDSMHQATGTQIKAMQKQIDLAVDVRREDVDALHEKINGVDRRLSGIESASELQNQTLAAVNADIKVILQRLPRRP
jgi:hypothetical protein